MLISKSLSEFDTISSIKEYLVSRFLNSKILLYRNLPLILRQNCSISQKIEELNSQLSSLYVENLQLRASEISLQSQLKREKEKCHKIMAEAEAAVCFSSCYPNPTAHPKRNVLTKFYSYRQSVFSNSSVLFASRTMCRPRSPHHPRLLISHRPPLCKNHFVLHQCYVLLNSQLYRIYMRIQSLMIYLPMMMILTQK